MRLYKTWKEIKDKFESEGVKDEDQIDYIDLSSSELEQTTFDNSRGMWEIHS